MKPERLAPSTLDAPASKPLRVGRSLLATLLGRGWSALAGWAAPFGRYSLYVGLLLVALTALRLPGGEGSLADPFLVVSMACALLVLMQGRILRIGLLRTHAIGLGLVVAGILMGTLAGSSDDWQSLLRLSKYLFATTATIVACIVLLERRGHVKTALACWVLSAAMTSAAAMLQAALGDPLFSDELLRGRMVGLSGSPNLLGPVAGMGIAGGLSLAATSDRLRSVLWLIVTLLCVAGVVVSASRAGAVVAAVSLGVWGLMCYRLRRELTMLALGCCLAGAAMASFLHVQVWSGADISDRLANATDPYADSAVASRLYQYEDVLRQALENPLVGVGLAPREVEVHGHEIHNTFLMLFRAGGLLSLAGIIVIVADLLLKGLEAYRRFQDRDSRVMAAAPFVGMTGMALSGIAGPTLYQRELWLPAALCMALLAIARQGGRQGRAATRYNAGTRSKRQRRRHKSSLEREQSKPRVPRSSHR